MLDDSMQRKCFTPKNDEFFIFPIADGTVKLSGGDEAFRKSTLKRDHSIRGEELRDDIRGESDGSQPTDTMMDDREARNDFWSIEGTCIYRHDVEPGVQLFVPKEESFAIPLWCIDADRNLSEPWTGFSQ